jgi:hypothetical protein
MRVVGDAAARWPRDRSRPVAAERAVQVDQAAIAVAARAAERQLGENRLRSVSSSSR